MRLSNFTTRIKKAINVLLAPEPIAETLPSVNMESPISLELTINQDTPPDNQPQHLSAQPGIQCPRCQCRIEILIPVLLSSMPIRCQNCSLELTVNQEKSADSMTALKKLHGDFEIASDMLNKATGKT